MSNTAVYSVDRIDLNLVPWSWPFAIERRVDINIYFAQQRRHNATLWNGRVLLSRKLLLTKEALDGMLFETDYASLLAALEWGAVGESVKVCFAAAALLAADGAFIVGQMAAHTRNAGQVLFPSGSLDPADVSNGKVDIYSSVLRELEEETGLTSEDFEPEPGWNVVLAGPHVPIVKVIRAKHPAERVAKRIWANLADQTQPEFSDIQIVRSPSDLDSRMPAWMHAFFAPIWC
jgi:8-oxo-dGTP pyrophosphatase MutT (NUDIX family)